MSEALTAPLPAGGLPGRGSAVARVRFNPTPMPQASLAYRFSVGIAYGSPGAWPRTGTVLADEASGEAVDVTAPLSPGSAAAELAPQPSGSRAQPQNNAHEAHSPIDHLTPCIPRVARLVGLVRHLQTSHVDSMYRATVNKPARHFFGGRTTPALKNALQYLTH
ncbi:MAG: hypothetical protein HIU89_06650 [Proteobacteria bacterium]|nr:hypothetical protein [Pseudomonadota bacterium]